MYLLKRKYSSWTSVSSWTETLYTPKMLNETKARRVISIDLLRGIVMIIMAIDHVRDYFHHDSFLYSPTDLSQTNVTLFFTRWITHFCAPVFVFLAGTSAYLYGAKKGKNALSFFLWTRGLWLIGIELFALSLFRTFNLTFPYFNLQVIWAIGFSMIILSAVVYMNARWILALGLLLVGAHNLLDGFHVPNQGLISFGWSVLHETHFFNVGRFLVYVHYPVLPWIGVMTLGYYMGRLYDASFDAQKRKKILLMLGSGAIVLFVLLRAGNWYGDPVHWSIQKNVGFSFLSFINVSKYPPSLLYVLVTLGLAMIFLALSENLGGKWTSRISIFGRTAMFYYLAHILLIHTAALFLAPLCGYRFSDMILSTSVFNSPQLKGYGFNLGVVYLVWICLILVLYPLCKKFDKYKRANLSKHWWLSYV